MSSTAVRSAAEKYASAGLRVLPIEPKGKRPLTAHGVHDASSDADQVRSWWRRWPDANVAIAVPPRWCVVDVDVRADGFLNLHRLVDQHGALPNTCAAETGSGGAHYIYRLPFSLKLRGKLTVGVDLLTEGRYFIAAPSVHPSGGRYRWLGEKRVALLPPWVCAMARVVEEPQAPPPMPPRTDAFDRARKYALAVPGAVSGQGGHVATFLLAQRLVRGFQLSDGQALAILTEWNELCQPRWSKRDLERKVLQARQRGTMAFGTMDRDRGNSR